MKLRLVVSCAMGSIVLFCCAAALHAKEGSASDQESRFAESNFYADVQRRAGPTAANREHEVRRLYSDFFAMLDLSVDDSDRLVSLLAEQQLLTTPWGSWSAKTNKVIKHEPQPAHLARAEAIEREITQMLGVERFQTLEDYKESLGERFLLRGLDERLNAAAVPLTDEQKNQLMKILIAQRPNLERKSRFAGTLEGSENVIKEMNANDVRRQQLFARVLTSDQERIATRHFQLRAEGREKALERYRQQILSGESRPIFTYPVE